MGHPPFGHSGQDVLDELMKEFGGFEHNLQTLRIVEQLEEKYIEFPGLNLTFESREGIVKHSTVYKGMKNPPAALKCFALDELPPLEAQIVDLCDEIAYNNHDLDDGLESRLLNLEQLVANVGIFGELFRDAKAKHPEAPLKLLVNATIINLINLEVTDLIDNIRRAIEKEGIKTLEDIRKAPRMLVSFSNELGDKHRELKAHLYKHLYNHFRVNRMKHKARRILEGLFKAYQEDPALMPNHFRNRMAADGKERVICDYIAGMTDRFAIDEYMKLFDPREKV
jgi:dGTPase